MSEVLPSMEELLKRAEAKGRADAIKEMERYIVDHGLYVTFKASEWAEQIKEESDE